jgi:hypothetical protein
MLCRRIKEAFCIQQRLFFGILADFETISTPPTPLAFLGHRLYVCVPSLSHVQPLLGCGGNKFCRSTDFLFLTLESLELLDHEFLLKECRHVVKQLLYACVP